METCPLSLPPPSPPPLITSRFGSANCNASPNPNRIPSLPRAPSVLLASLPRLLLQPSLRCRGHHRPFVAVTMVALHGHSTATAPSRSRSALAFHQQWQSPMVSVPMAGTMALQLSMHGACGVVSAPAWVDLMKLSILKCHGMNIQTRIGIQQFHLTISSASEQWFGIVTQYRL